MVLLFKDIYQLCPVHTCNAISIAKTCDGWTCVEQAQGMNFFSPVACVCICICVDIVQVQENQSHAEKNFKFACTFHVTFSCFVCENLLVFAFVFAVYVWAMLCCKHLIWFSFCDSQLCFLTLQVVELVLVQCLAVWSLVMPGIHPSSNSFSRMLF